MGPDLQDRYTGAMLGLALADALGARREGGAIAGYLWGAIVGGGKKALRWTDDTQMSMLLAESLLECGGVDADRLARRWADGMEGWRGYGPGARKLLQRIAKGEDWRTASRSVFPDGSFGNGAAMRAAPLGLFYRGRPEDLETAAELAASITHVHPLGIEGCVLIARAVAYVLERPFEPGSLLDRLLDSSSAPEYTKRLKLARTYLDEEPRPKEVKQRLGTRVRAHESAVTAVYLFCRFNDDYRSLIEYIIMLGGDTDTIGAMAAGIFGALRGKEALPADLLDRLEARDRLDELGRALHAASLGARK